MLLNLSVVIFCVKIGEGIRSISIEQYPFLLRHSLLIVLLEAVHNGVHEVTNCR
jgi:hypothetical protein